MSKLLKKIGLNSRKALNSSISPKKKNKVLKDFVKLIEINKNKIISENKKDIFYARGKKLKENLIQRLALNNNKLKSIIDSVKTITSFKDPVNQVTSKWKRPNGLEIRRVTIPIGVIGVIFESRPNVTSDVSALCFKSGNAVILRGGSEASEPPLNITAFPDLKHSADTSDVTLGLLSNITPITPIGIVTLLISSPFGLFHLEVTWLTGSLKEVIVLTESIILFNLLLLRASLWIKFSFNFFPLA